MDPFAAQRNQANLRSIIRSDPSVVEILETSVYSTIYHFVKPEGVSIAEGEWVKQKAEGPTFIVRRNTIPEHAIFMLNRQTVKNVMIPLIKGEMKATSVGEGMLQVARRGEKVRRGVWFSELVVAEQFQAEITRICGPPSQRPDSTNPSTNSPITLPPFPQPATSLAPSGSNGPAPTPAVDGFSRLFAGLMTTPSISTTPPPQPPIPAATSHQSPIALSQVSQPQSAASVPLPQVPPATSHIAVSSPVSHPAEAQAQAQPPPIPYATHPPAELFTPPPGQTVDDLLNSILGINASTFPSFPPPAQSQVQSLHPSITAQQDLPPPETAPPIPVETKPEALQTMLSTATERESHLANTSMVRDPSTGSIVGGPLSKGSALNGRTNSAMGPAPYSLATSGPGLEVSPSAHPGFLASSSGFLAPLAQSLPLPTHSSKGVPGNAPISIPIPIATQPTPPQQSVPQPSAPPLEGPPPPGQSTMALGTSILHALGGVRDLRPIGRDGFRQVLADLIQNEPRFVDDLWEGYLRRMSSGAGG